MFHIFHLRSRVLQVLILGLISLTFYAYYRSTVGDPRNVGHLPLAYEASLRSNVVNASADFQSTSSPKNATLLDTSAPHANASRGNVSNPSTLLATSSSSGSGSSSSSSQSPSSSRASTNVKPSDEKPAKPITPPANSSGSGPPNSASARAIYPPGHAVSIPERCPNYGRGMDLLVAITSAPNHFDARTAIRQTWGHFGQRSDVGVLFVLGATLDARLEKILQREQEVYNDVIRGRFIDSYSNLTLKTISTLEWVNDYCPEVKFLLKTDDDMFINVPRLLSFVSGHAADRNVIFGRLAKKWKPIRNKKSKYYVSPAQYKPAIYPDFTTGPAYLVSSDVIARLYNASLEQTYLKLEDVYTTGIVASKLGIKRAHATEFLNKKIAYNPCNIQRGISIHMVKYSEQFDLWKKLLDGKSKCK